MKSLLKTADIRLAGRAHSCRSNKKHVLVKGDAMLVVKEGREERHYCSSCAEKIIAVAREKLKDLDQHLGSCF